MLNDIVSKKGMAVKQIVKKLDLSNASTLCGSIANVELNQPFDIISKHAFKINDLYQMVIKKDWKRLIFYKGINFESELEGINQPLQVNAYSLYKNGERKFYKGKVLVMLSR